MNNTITLSSNPFPLLIHDTQNPSYTQNPTQIQQLKILHVQPHSEGTLEVSENLMDLDAFLMSRKRATLPSQCNVLESCFLKDRSQFMAFALKILKTVLFSEIENQCYQNNERFFHATPFDKTVGSLCMIIPRT